MRRAWLGILLSAVTVSATVAQERSNGAFDHPKHRGLFPSCLFCHDGITDEARSPWPAAASCASCHDGTIEERVTWRPPTALARTNLRFEHREHARELRAAGGDSALCIACHFETDTAWMAVRRTVVERCIACHDIQTSHLEAPDRACAQCHVPLAMAVRLTAEDVRTFPEPRSHESSAFAEEEHGRLAASGSGVAASCATCHARDFCVSCHVDAPERPAIQALAPDVRSLVYEARLEEPASHRGTAFVTGHGPAARASAADCATCHTRESCMTCHVSAPREVAALPRAGPGRGAGALVERRPPTTHVAAFTDGGHRSDAAVVPASCAGCHVRENCLDCHRPNAATAARYHPSNFLTRHPAAAYSRETSCGDCHNVGSFCASCHVGAGLRSTKPLGSGYHDAKRSFIAGHGQAARQELESCVSCHVERDCLSCHSALGGRRFNPHGPGFDAARLRRKNPEVCLVCHGSSIPGGS